MSKYSSVGMSIDGQVFTCQSLSEKVEAAIRGEGFEAIADVFAKGAVKIKTADEMVAFADQFVVFEDRDELVVFDGLKALADHLSSGSVLPAVKEVAKKRTTWFYEQVAQGSWWAYDDLVNGNKADDFTKVKAIAIVAHGRWSENKSHKLFKALGALNQETARALAYYAMGNTYVSGFRDEMLSIDEETTLFVLGEMPEYIEFVEQTPERCLAAVKGDGAVLIHIKEQTPEICRAAVKSAPLSLEYVKDITGPLALLACRNDGIALRFVPKHIQTEEIILAAVKNTGYSLKYAAFQTEEICIQAIMDDDSNGYGWAIGDVNDQTEKVCWTALRKNFRTYRTIKAPTVEMCEYVCKNSPSFSLANELPHFTYNMFVQSMNSDSSTVAEKKALYENFDLKKLTVEMAVHYLEKGFAPSGIRLEESREMLLGVLRKNGALLGSKLRKRDLEMCTVAVMSDPSAIQFVPKKFH